MPAVRNRRDPRYLRDHPVAPEPETPDLDAFAQDVRIYLEARNAYLAACHAFMNEPYAEQMRAWWAQHLRDCRPLKLRGVEREGAQVVVGGRRHRAASRAEGRRGGISSPRSPLGHHAPRQCDHRGAQGVTAAGVAWQSG